MDKEQGSGGGGGGVKCEGEFRDGGREIGGIKNRVKKKNSSLKIEKIKKI